MLNKNLISLLGDDKRKLVYITILNIISLLTNVMITGCFCYVLYKAYMGSYELTTYLLPLLMIILGIIFRYVLIIKVGETKKLLGSKVKYTFRKKVIEKVYKLGISEDKNSTATMSQLVIEGIEQLNLYFTMFLPQFFYGMSAPIILFLICLIFEWKTALVLIMCLPFIPISIMLVSRFAKKIFSKYWDKYISMGDGFLDSVNGMKELKIFNADEKKQKEIAEKSEEFRKITMKVLVMQLCSLTIIDMVAFGGAGLAIVVTLSNTSENSVAIFQGLFLILICAEFFLPMRGLGSAFHIAMNGSTAGNTLMEFLNQEVKVDGDLNLEKIDTIALENITFSYEDSKNILENISIDLNKGLNAIVGTSGSGKSTITSLLIRGHAAQKGVVTINHIPVEHYKLSSYYKKLSIVGMNTHIFNMSIRENFQLINPSIKDDEIFNALKKVNLYDFIQRVGGLDYVILEDSQNISGGQKQRLAFAIHTSKPTDLYIFDEPTSNIDTESESIIMRNITTLAKDSIVLLISHRLQNVKNANQILMLKDQKIYEKGSHETLMENQGPYCDLYTEQYNLENGYKEVTKHA